MSSLTSPSFQILSPQWRHRSLRFFIFLRSKRSFNGGFVPRLASSSSNNDSASAPKQSQFGYDPSVELFGLEVNPKPRNGNFGLEKPRSWFGPNGQYIRELPCPTCRGRGYTPCLECGIERSRPDCSKCEGKSLNAKTGLFSKRMKIIHRDPKLHAQRVAAIKKAKGTAAARKRASEALKAFFSDPENRRKRSIAMKGVKFYCQNCGREGHRRHYCPELKDLLTGRKFRCRVCGEKGHNIRTCPITRLNSKKDTVQTHHHCGVCRQRGHNRRTCPKLVSANSSTSDVDRGSPHPRSRKYKCQACKESGHNIRTCPSRNVPTSEPP